MNHSELLIIKELALFTLRSPEFREILGFELDLTDSDLLEIKNKLEAESA